MTDQTESALTPAELGINAAKRDAVADYHYRLYWNGDGWRFSQTDNGVEVQNDYAPIEAVASDIDDEIRRQLRVALWNPLTVRNVQIDRSEAHGQRMTVPEEQQS